MNDDPLLPLRAAPREAPADLKQRIMAVIGDDIDRMHLEHVRFAVQERLHKELGISVIFQDPVTEVAKAAPITIPITAWTEYHGNSAKLVSRKKSTIPIPNHRRKWWER